MAKIVFRLRHVPDDEAEDIRTLLQDHRFEFYETSAGRWGIGLPAIWLTDDSDFEPARLLIERYQIERRERLQIDYAQRRERGEVETVLQRLQQHPVRVVVYVAVILVILYFSVTPFFDLLAA